MSEVRQRIRAVKKSKEVKRESLNSFLDKNMQVNYRGSNSPKRHRVQSKYISYDSVTQEQWDLIFGK